MRSTRIYNILVGTIGWKRPLGRPKLKWEYNIKIMGFMGVWDLTVSL
jgi:hypothetical protein